MLKLIQSFRRYEMKIGQYIDHRIGSYFESSCFKKLKNRYIRLDDSLDMKFHIARNRSRAPNDWKSKISVPLVREAMLARRAITRANYRADPLITVLATGATPQENAANMQDILVANLRSTRYREKAFRPLTNYASRYGVGVSYLQYAPQQESYTKTIETRFGYERMQVSGASRKNCKAKPIHPLNYFQNENIADPCESDFQGHIERVPLDVLMAEARQNSDFYIKDNLLKVINEAKKSQVADEYFHGRDAVDFNRVGVDIRRWWGKVNIKGNEEDQTIYAVEMAGPHVIRIQENPYDENIRPYAIFNYDQRLEYWWGNVDSENVLPHENFMNIALNMTADNALRSLERYIFFGKGSIDPADLNNRHKNGGFIGVDLKNQRLSDLISEYQGRDFSTNPVDFILREMKESAQRVRPKADLSRQSQQGGIQNKTATAAMLLDEQGDMLEADLLEGFNFGLIQTGRIMSVLLQEYLGDRVMVRPKARESVRYLEKREFLGQYDYTIETAMTRNKASESMRLLNVVTGILNFKGSMDPSIQDLNIRPIVREWLKKVDAHYDIDEILPDEPIAAPGAVPTQINSGQAAAGPVQEVVPPMATNPPSPAPAMTGAA